MAIRVLVAGFGNIFLGDDGFGCEIARRVAARSLPEGVRVVDFGIRGIDFAFALLEAPSALILVDAMHRSGPPGTLYVVEPCVAEAEGLSAHGLPPERVIGLARAMGARVPHIRVVGCEPFTFGVDGIGGVGLSAPVMAIVDEATELTLSLVVEACAFEDERIARA